MNPSPKIFYFYGFLSAALAVLNLSLFYYADSIVSAFFFLVNMICIAICINSIQIIKKLQQNQ